MNGAPTNNLEDMDEGTLDQRIQTAENIARYNITIPHDGISTEPTHHPRTVHFDESLNLLHDLPPKTMFGAPADEPMEEY
tara:strand:+ start:1990 stop:2229 length:240 start_codon:yes stop_codon:yes gene_type:complete